VGKASVEEALLTCHEVSFAALADMDRLWRRIREIPGLDRPTAAQQFLRISNRADPVALWDPDAILGERSADLYGLPVIRPLDAFVVAARKILESYREPHVPPLWLRLVDGWAALLDALGLAQNICGVSVSINNREGSGVAGASVVPNAYRNKSHVTQREGFNGSGATKKVATFVNTLEKPPSGIEPLIFVSAGIRFASSSVHNAEHSVGPYLQVIASQSGSELPNALKSVVLPENVGARYQDTWLAALWAWMYPSVLPTDSDLASLREAVASGGSEEWLLRHKETQLRDYCALISQFLPNQEWPQTIDSLFCPAVFWSVDPAHQGSAANCYFLFDTLLSQDQARLLLLGSQILLAGVGQFSTGHFLDAQRAGELERSEQMLALLHRPLQELSRSIGTMQRDTQQLRAILYDPAKGIFSSHQLLAELFDEDRPVNVSNDCVVRISHNNSYGKLAPDDDSLSPDERYGTNTDGRAVLAVALLRLLGRADEIRHLRTRSLIIVEARAILRTALKDPVFRPLLTDVAWVLSDCNESDDLVACLEDHHDATQCLKDLKATLFDPFKLQRADWDLRTFRLACRAYKAADEVWPATSEQFTLHVDRNPLPYNATVTFCLDAAAEAFHRKANACCVTAINTASPPAEAPQLWRTITVRFAGDYLLPQFPDGALRLIDLINDHIFAHPRDWRVDEAHVGNFQKPFVDLASRALGIGTSWLPVPKEHLYASEEEAISEIFALAKRLEPLGGKAESSLRTNADQPSRRSSR
jgi:hypothetical protein